MRERTRQSLGHSDFEEITESTLLIIVKEDLLDISEVELFDAAKRWASRQCSQRDLEITGTNMRQVFFCHTIIIIFYSCCILTYFVY